RYDVIEMDALTPYLGYSGNVLSAEFFALCASRLKPGGLMCAWVPTARVRHGILAAFPHAVSFAGDAVLVASSDPIPVEPALWAARLDKSGGARYLGAAIHAEVVEALAHPSPVRLRVPGAELNHDLSPADEFLRPLRRPAHAARASAP